MNLINTTLIDLLISAAETLKESVTQSLQKYRENFEHEKQVAKQFKDEAGYLSGKQNLFAGIARDEIAKAERIFSGKVADYAGQMEKELQKHIAEPVNVQFRESLKLISDLGLKPERMDIESLIALNGNSQLGLSALDQVLRKNEAGKLNYHSTADYQNDLLKIRDITRNLRYIPADYLHEGIEVYKGILGDRVNEYGAVLGNAITYDSVTLLANASNFEGWVSFVESLKNAWGKDCSYTTADKASAEQQETMEAANELLRKDEYEEIPIPDPQSEIRIEEDPENSEAMRMARELGKEKAKARDTVQGLQHYFR